MSDIKIKDPFDGMTNEQVKELVNKSRGYDITTIENKRPDRDYVLVKDNPVMIRQYELMGYVPLNETTSRGEKVMGADRLKPHTVLDTQVMYTDRRIREERDRADEEDNRKRMGSYRREFIREIREAEREAGIKDSRKMDILKEKNGKFQKIDDDEGGE